MKKLLIVLGIILVLAGILFYVQYMQMSRTVQPVFVPQIQTQETQKVTDEIILDKEIKIGDMLLVVPTDLKQSAEMNMTTFEISGAFKGLTEDKSPKEFLSQSMRIFYNKNAKTGYVGIQEWFDNEGPQTKPTATFPDATQKKVSPSGIEYLESVYVAPTGIYNTNYYDVVMYYFGNKDDIYRIVFYKESENKDIVLTVEQKESIKKYEKIVDQIIQSIHFVK